MNTKTNKGMIQRGSNSLAITIAKIYIFSLTFKMIMPLRFLESIIGSAALSFDILPHFFGILILLFERNGKITLCEDNEGKTLLYFFEMIIWFTLSSIIMAVIIQQSYGNMGNESAYKGIIGMIIYWAQYALILFYNYHVYKILTISEMEKTLKAEITMLLLVGYFQMGVMTFGGQLARIYDQIDILDLLNDSKNLPKLSLTGSEGAYTGYIIGTLVLPYIYARNLACKTKKGILLSVLLWLPIIYMSFSSGAYILCFLTTIGYLFYYIKTRGISKSIITAIGMIILVGAVILFFGNDLLNILPSDISNNIRYLLFEKIQDNDNGSTVLRSIPFYYNWGAFTEYPFIGVGNGLQGYFLEKYLPASMAVVKGVDTAGLMKRWTSGISNGSLFWPSILSGYGLVGVLLVIIYIIKSERLLRTKKEELGTMYYMYRLSLIGVIFAGFATDFVAKYYVWFAISLPLIPVLDKNTLCDDKENKKVSKYRYLR